MADLPSEPAVDARLRDFLATELRKAELDFPHLTRPQQVRARRRLPIGILAAAVAVLLLVVVAPRFVGPVFEGTAGTPMGADGLPLSINGEPVLRGEAIASRLGGDGGFLAGGTLVLDTGPCLSLSERAQIGCEQDWTLVSAPLSDPVASFVLDGAATAPGFVRTSGALTVVRVGSASPVSGVLVVEEVVWRQPTKGPVPADATPPEGGTTNDALWPDFVAAWDRDGVTIAGYVPKRYLLDGGPLTPGGSPSNPPQGLPVPVYGEDLTTLVGHMVPGVGFVALGSTDVPAGPSVSVAPASVAPSPSGASGTPASTVRVGDWLASCEGVETLDCQGAVERFTNLLARSTATVFDQSGGNLTVTARPICPVVPDWADGSYCWQVSATGTTWSSTNQPVCMVIARRGTDVRYPAYVSVGGPDGTGRAGGMPEGWPSCD